MGAHLPGAVKSKPLKLFAVFFLSKRLEFECDILSIHDTILSTFICQVAFNNL